MTTFLARHTTYSTAFLHYFPEHMSAESPSNISPNPLEVISEVLKLKKIKFEPLAPLGLFLCFLKVFFENIR